MKTSAFLTICFALVLATAALFAQSASVSPSGPSLPSDSPKTTNTGKVSVPAAPSDTAAATSTAAQTGQPSEGEMMKQMTEIQKPNENHRLLSDLDGTWTYTLTMSMNPDPSAKPIESKGTATRKSIMDGRYIMMEVTGKFPLAGADGKMKDMTFKGMEIAGYDNVKKKFVGSWIDNTGTGIMMSEGSYDPVSKTFTYTAEEEMMPGKKKQVREVLKVTDKDHMVFEGYENAGAGERKTMEINYTRARK